MFAYAFEFAYKMHFAAHGCNDTCAACDSGDYDGEDQFKGSWTCDFDGMLGLALAFDEQVSNILVILH